MKRISLLFSFAAFLSFTAAPAQCDTTYVSGDFIQGSDVFLSGTYIVSGTFQINPGVTIYVQQYAFGGCGSLEVQANKIIIHGAINGDYAGYEGGNGGAGGVLVTSLTGDVTALDDCSNKDNTGQVTVEGGKGGFTGNGSGGGNGGTVATNGSGPKQQCGNNGDDAGLIGSGGGGGGGGGGSYGGIGNAGAPGGDGANAYTTNNINVSPAFVVVMGQGGAGGNAGAAFGSQSGMDISLGSGGAGAGGGGRSYAAGLNGNHGGAGGGMVKLIATDTFLLSATALISVNGQAGQNGGNGGGGGVSPKCCNDGCDDCGEATLSCGSGGGSGAGGGSGGGIFIMTNGAVSIQGTLRALGGNGGSYGLKGLGAACSYSGNLFCDANDVTSGDGDNGANGGAGGGGRIKIFAVQDCGSVTPVMNVTGGVGPVTAATTGTAEVICTTGLAETQPVAALRVYPNPASTLLVAEYAVPAGVYNTQVTIYDLAGRAVTAPVDTQQEGRELIDVSALAPGIYFCVLEGEGVNVVKKFVRQ